jgi:hypothetical protein
VRGAFIAACEVFNRSRYKNAKLGVGGFRTQDKGNRLAMTTRRGLRYLILNRFFTASRNRKISVALTGICASVSMNVTVGGMCGCSALPS